MGGPEKWQKRGRAKQVLSHFCHHGKGVFGHFEESSTFKSELASGVFLC